MTRTGLWQALSSAPNLLEEPAELRYSSKPNEKPAKTTAANPSDNMDNMNLNNSNQVRVMSSTSSQSFQTYNYNQQPPTGKVANLHQPHMMGKIEDSPMQYNVTQQQKLFYNPQSQQHFNQMSQPYQTQPHQEFNVPVQMSNDGSTPQFIPYNPMQNSFEKQAELNLVRGGSDHPNYDRAQSYNPLEFEGLPVAGEATEWPPKVILNVTLRKTK